VASVVLDVGEERHLPRVGQRHGRGERGRRLGRGVARRLELGGAGAGRRDEGGEGFRVRSVPKERHLTVEEANALVRVLPERRRLWVLLAMPLAAATTSRR
jgi:hypothetical protein